MCQAMPEGQVARVPRSWHGVYIRSLDVTPHTAILEQVLAQRNYIHDRTTSKA